MADNFDTKARAIARAVVDEMQNRGMGLTIEEASSVAAALTPEAAGGYCTSCGYEFTSDDLALSKCPKCGNKKASQNPKYRCVRCNRPVDKFMPSCPSCGTKEAVLASRSVEV